MRRLDVAGEEQRLGAEGGGDVVIAEGGVRHALRRRVERAAIGGVERIEDDHEIQPPFLRRVAVGEDLVAVAVGDGRARQELLPRWHTLEQERLAERGGQVERFEVGLVGQLARCGGEAHLEAAGRTLDDSCGDGRLAGRGLLAATGDEQSGREHRQQQRRAEAAGATIRGGRCVVLTSGHRSIVLMPRRQGQRTGSPVVEPLDRPVRVAGVSSACGQRI